MTARKMRSNERRLEATLARKISVQWGNLFLHTILDIPLRSTIKIFRDSIIDSHHDGSSSLISERKLVHVLKYN